MLYCKGILDGTCPANYFLFSKKEEILFTQPQSAFYSLFYYHCLYERKGTLHLC